MADATMLAIDPTMLLVAVGAAVTVCAMLAAYGIVRLVFALVSPRRTIR